MKLGNDNIHHTQFLISCLLAILFSCCVYRILQRTLQKDLAAIERNHGALRRFKRNRAGVAYDSLSIFEESHENSSTASERQPKRELKDTFGFE